MSRSGYTEDYSDQWDWIRWRGAVKSAIRGARGQAFLKELLYALDHLPKLSLIVGELERGGEVCALGAVGRHRGLDMEGLDPEDFFTTATAFDIPCALAQEIMYINDEEGLRTEPGWARFNRVREWVRQQIK